MFFKKGVHKNFANFTQKHMCWSLFLNKVARLRACSFIKKRFQYRCFPVKFAKFLITRFFYRTLPVAASGQLSLCPVINVQKCNVRKKQINISRVNLKFDCIFQKLVLMLLRMNLSPSITGKKHWQQLTINFCLFSAQWWANQLLVLMFPPRRYQTQRK